MDPAILSTFGASLARCNESPSFLDRFYERFLGSSDRVKEKFAKTDFVRQKQALRHSLQAMLLAAAENGQAGQYLDGIAERHSSRDLNIGAEHYDYWLDSLLETVKECDPQYSPEVARAWEAVMMVGIGYLLSKY